MTGVWLENDRTLDYYLLRDGDSLDYICRMRNLRIRLLDGEEFLNVLDFLAFLSAAV